MKQLLIFITLILSITLFADEKGEEIARKGFNLKESKDDYSIALMVLINKNGNKKVRKLKMYSKQTSEGRNSFSEFLEPADVSGTKFLTIGHDKADDEQRLYLPALGKVRRISSSKKGGSFMGSDINYFDMEDHDFPDFTYKYIKDEAYNNMDCHVVEYFPTDKNAPYSKQVAWINKEDFFTYKIECYDKKAGQKHMKTIVIAETVNIDGVIQPKKMVVDNHLQGTKTLFQMNEIKINIGIKDEIFTVKNLTK